MTGNNSRKQYNRHINFYLYLYLYRSTTKSFFLWTIHCWYLLCFQLLSWPFLNITIFSVIHIDQLDHCSIFALDFSYNSTNSLNNLINIRSNGYSYCNSYLWYIVRTLSSQEYELKVRKSIPFSVGQVGFSFPLSLFGYAQFLQVCDFAQTVSYYVLHWGVSFWR